jgi:hypothetical protein
VRSATSTAGQSEVRSQYLVDGGQYRLRLRAWGGGTQSLWTDYITVTATADPVPPGAVAGVTVTEGVGQALFEWTAPNSSNYFACRIYISSTNNINTATLMATEYGPPSAVDNRAILGLAPGVRYGWLVAINASGVPASATATGAFTIT